MRTVGIIGAGHYGIQHANALDALEDVQLVAASRTNAAALAEFTQRYGIKGYTDYRDLLADPEIEIVVIATPHHHHTVIAEDAARAGKHILLEKPMAPSLPECDCILEAAQKANVQLMLGHVNRFARAYQVAKQMIESGEMGRVIMGSAAMQKFWFEPNRRDWHLDRAKGGGVWLSVGLHPLDRLTWLIDSPIISVSAQFGTHFHQMDADDTGLVFLRYENGAAGTVISTGYSVGAPKHTTELTCTRGMLNIDYSMGVQVGRDESWQTIPESLPEGSWMHEALVREWRGFLDALDRGCEPPVSGRSVRHIMAAAFAAEQSSAEGREVRLEEFEV
jgi:phthalate 4,5-cis-dihydrodiol dehydrogenase